MSNQPKFIVVDGPDGAGKTTIVSEMKDYLTAKGYNVLVGRGLGTGTVAEAIRKSLFNPEFKKSPNYEIYGAIMCLIDCYETFVVPNLLINDDKLIIILDRYLSSYYAYQVHARGSEKANKMLKDAFNIPGTRHPDAYIYCNVSLEVATSRINSRDEQANYFDQETQSFRNRVAEGFNIFFDKWPVIHNQSPSKIVRLNCDQDLEGVYNQLYTYLENTFVSKVEPLKLDIEEPVAHHSV